MESPKCFVEIGVAPLDFREGCIVLVGGRMPVHCIIKFIKKPVTFLNYYKTAAD